MKKQIARLIDLKSILTIVISVALVIFTNKGVIGPDSFIGAVGMVFGFYFSKKQDKTETETGDTTITTTKDI